MADTWYFSHDTETFGPFSAKRMKELASTGEVCSQDTVWREGMETGVLAARVKNLFAVEGRASTVAAAAVEARPPPPKAISAEPKRVAVATSDSDAAILDVPLNPDGPPRAEPPEGETAAPGQAVADPEQKDSSSPRDRPPPQQQAARKRRAISIKGGVIMSQDGVAVRFRKSCVKCSYADTSITTAPIQTGVTRVHFFCPKCRKNHPVEIQGVS